MLSGRLNFQLFAAVQITALSLGLTACNQGHNEVAASDAAQQAAQIQSLDEFKNYVLGAWCMPGNVQGLGTDLSKVEITLKGKSGTRYRYLYRLGLYRSGWSDNGMAGVVSLGTERDVNTGQYFYYASLQDTALMLVKHFPAYKDGAVEFYSGDNPVLVGRQDCGHYE